MKKALIAGCLVLNLLGSNAVQAALSPSEIQKAYVTSYQYEKTQNYTDAIKAISLISIQSPKDFTVNLRLGYLFYKQGKYANALKHYQQAHQIRPQAISPLLGEMSVGIAQKNYAQAELAGFTILKADFNNYYANLKLAYLFIQTKNIDSAKKIIYKMLALYPTNVAFLTQLGKLYVLQKNWTAATATYYQVQTLDPENVNAKYYFSFPKLKKVTHKP